jgi:microcystin-dependent protein
MVMDYAGSSAPSGWLLLSGRTIGSASSSATERANADTAALFAFLWGEFSNTELTIQDSSGSNTTRGANAAADFAANKRLPLPDCRGRVIAGKDDMGGSTASRLTNGNSGITGTTLGAAGGLETMKAHTHTFTTGTESQSHTHSITTTGPNSVNGTSGAGGGAAVGSVNTGNASQTHTHSGTTDSTGTGSSHGNVQPTFIMSKIIKL